MGIYIRIYASINKCIFMCKSYAYLRTWTLSAKSFGILSYSKITNLRIAVIIQRIIIVVKIDVKMVVINH